MVYHYIYIICIITYYILVILYINPAVFGPIVDTPEGIARGVYHV